MILIGSESNIFVVVALLINDNVSCMFDVYIQYCTPGCMSDCWSEKIFLTKHNKEKIFVCS